MSKKYALLSVGELLVDFISTEKTESLLEATDFQRFQGGSPANMAANMARLGGKVALVSAVGNDNLGEFLINEIAKTGIDTQYIVKCDIEPTTIVLVSKTSTTPDFIAYRMADKMLEMNHLPDNLLSDIAIFHTTCFALSQEPAQSTILDAAQKANRFGAKVTIDCNYASKIWPNRKQAWQIIGKYCNANAFVKLSEDDAERLYSYKVENEQIIHDLHEMGAELVCLTLGRDGAIISYNFGENTYRIFGDPIKVVDATGAGDAFWSGFLTAYLDGKTIPECGDAATKMAVLKLQTLGPLGETVDKGLIY